MSFTDPIWNLIIDSDFFPSRTPIRKFFENPTRLSQRIFSNWNMCIIFSFYNNSRDENFKKNFVGV
uniref:Uncharacterized protein n=1 Tax=Meloidogyne incognita TaxID=6306 RepID=A0A914LJ83_MELIC